VFVRVRWILNSRCFCEMKMFRYRSQIYPKPIVAIYIRNSLFAAFESSISSSRLMYVTQFSEWHSIQNREQCFDWQGGTDSQRMHKRRCAGIGEDAKQTEVRRSSKTRSISARRRQWGHRRIDFNINLTLVIS